MPGETTAGVVTPLWRAPSLVGRGRVGRATRTPDDGDLATAPATSRPAAYPPATSPSGASDTDHSGADHSGTDRVEVDPSGADPSGSARVAAPPPPPPLYAVAPRHISDAALVDGEL